MMRLTAIAAVSLCGLAGPALAAQTTIDATSAAMCAKAASLGLADADSLQLCTEAIEQGALSRHDLIATYVNRGAVSMNRHDYAGARADFDRAIEMDPNAGEAWMDRGSVAVIEHRYRDGITDISKAIELGVQDPAKAYFNRAVAYEGVGDVEAAYVDYQEAMVLKPGWDLPKRELLRFTITRKADG
jgi:tetratricopeptide (TPR) repeat protein